MVKSQIDNSSERPGSEDTNTSGQNHLPRGIPDTPDGLYNTEALSRRDCQVTGRPFEISSGRQADASSIEPEVAQI